MKPKHTKSTASNACLFTLGLCSVSIVVALAAPAKRTAGKPAVRRTTTAAKPAPAVSPNDPQRFSKIKEWKGIVVVTSEDVGNKKNSYSNSTWSSSIKVDGTFTLAPHYDERNVNPFSLRGRGQAVVEVTGKRVTQSGSQTITTTCNGSYIDNFSVEIANIDPQKGTYEMSVIRDLWQKQPNKGEDFHWVEVTRTPRHTSVHERMSSGYAWANDAGAGFGYNKNLPKTGFIIKGSKTNKTSNLFASEGTLWKSNWVIRPTGPGFDEPLKAVAGGPYTVERGQKLTLNGNKSTGKVRSYKWTFAPADDKSPIPFNAGARKEGALVSTVLLAPVKATLTVSDGKKEDSETVVINVRARDYKTPFVHREGEKLHSRSIAPRMIKGRDLKYAGGENVCALDDYGAKDSVHILHPASAASGTWEDLGYKLKQVQDASGPFDGVWYFSEYSLQVERETLINKYILPGGPPPVRTAKPFYESNKQLGNDVDGYLEAVRKHEMLHTQLMQKALAGNDPGLKLEASGSKNKDDLKKFADETIKASENAIDKASEDPLPSVGWKGKIAFPDDATDKYISIDMDI